METVKAIRKQLAQIADIRYDNPNGGPYAYLQFMAFARELALQLMRVGEADREIERLEAASWMFNEYLGQRFTHAQKVIFENEMAELKPVFVSLALLADELEKRMDIHVIDRVAEYPVEVAA